MKRRRKWGWFAVGMAIIAVAAGLAWYGLAGRTKTVEAPTAVVARRNLVATVTATGTIRPIVGGEVRVGSRIPGRVTKLAVQVGDAVKVGQVIAVLEHEDLQAALDRTRSELVAAEARVAQIAADLLTVRRTAELGVARETARLSSASARLQLVQRGALPEEIAQVEAAVRQAEANHQLARANLERAKVLFENGLVARRDLDVAERDLAVAVAQVGAAREQLSLVRNRIRPEEITIAREEVRQAEVGLALAQADADKIAAKQRDLETARAQARSAGSTVRIAETNLAYATIRAPIDGIVASVSTQQGETVTSGSAAAAAPTFVTVVDLGRLEVHAFVDETDIGKVQVGQQTVFTVDAFPAREFTGKVVAIYPKALVQLNVVTYDVVVAIENPDGVLRPDMTTNVTVVVAQRDQVLAIPNQAVRREDGDRVAYVLEAGRPLRRVIKTGWRDKTHTEILGGLREGDRVIVGEVGGAGAVSPQRTTLPAPAR